MSRKPGSLIGKDPDAVEPYGFDWTDWLAELGSTVTITNSTWTVTGPDALLTLTFPTIVTGALKTQVTLNGGTLGRKYLVTNRIVTNTSNPTVQDDRSFTVLIEQK